MRGQEGLLPVAVRDSTHELLIQQGYKLIDDAWTANRRLTYDDANREFVASLAKVLLSAGWQPHPTTLRAFRHPKIADGIIEVEPGGSETSGHFLH
jgi:hypothetical protein